MGDSRWVTVTDGGGLITVDHWLINTSRKRYGSWESKASVEHNICSL